MIVHIKKIVAQAQKGGFAIGAFNTSNLEMTLAIVRGAVAMKSPIIIQISRATIAYAGLKNIVAIIKSIAETDGKSIDIAMHLDHGKDFGIIKECIANGFSSIHSDNSDFALAKNIALTKKAVEYAHSKGVWAQGELGSLSGKEGMSGDGAPVGMGLTDPSQVKEFITKTKVDTLAVSVGTIHGSFVGKEKIDLKLLSEINKIAKIPLVLHGASGNKSEAIKSAVKSGIKIVNIDTDLRIAFTNTLQKTLSSKNNFYDPRKILAPSIDAAQKEVMEKIKAFGSGKTK